MHHRNLLLSLLLASASLLPLALTAPPPAPNDPVSCDYEPRVHVDRSHCTTLLRRIGRIFWIHLPIVYGMDRPSPGRIPTDIDLESCHLVLRAKRFTHPVQTERFKLGDFYGALMEIDKTCLAKGYTGGAADIGRDGLFYAYLGGLEADRSEVNGTVVPVTDGESASVKLPAN